MKSIAVKPRIGISLLLALFATMTMANSDAQETMVVEGLVRDISCPLQNKATTAAAFNVHCALECARQGSPLIILDTDGFIYVPISGSMPDADQRPRLLPFVGKYVKVSGKVYERQGTRAIAIAEIVEMKRMPPVSDGQ